MGKYARIAKAPANTIHAPNFARSATAPEINATVMIANDAANKLARNVSFVSLTAKKSLNGFPEKSSGFSTMDIPRPINTHSTPTRAIVPTDIIIIEMTLFALTSPP